VKVLVVSGAFPRDIGGPATHAADLCDELRERGHNVSVMSYGDARRPIVRDNLVRFPRSWPGPVRTIVAIAWLAFSDYDAFMHDPPVPPPEAPHAVFGRRTGAAQGAGFAARRVVGRGRGAPDRTADVGRRVEPRATTPEPSSRRAGRHRAPRRTDDSSTAGRAVRSVVVSRASLADRRPRPGRARSNGERKSVVPPGDAELLAAAMIETLSDRDRVRAMGHAARCRALAWDPLQDFELGIARLGEWISAPA
jgi:hypothetical protein